MRFTVVLNGTDENPWHAFGLKQNPFPQVARAGVTGPLLHLAALGGDPVPDVAAIRRHLEGWSPEFVALCCARFRPGEVVKFDVEFKD